MSEETRTNEEKVVEEIIEKPKFYQIKIDKYRVNIKDFGEILAYENIPIRVCEACNAVRWNTDGLCDCGRNCWNSQSTGVFVEKELTKEKLNIMVTGLLDQDIGFEINEIFPIAKWKPKESKKFKIMTRLPEEDKLPEGEIE